MLQVVRGNFVPLTPRAQRGFFEIVVQRDMGEPGDALMSTKSEREFSRFLDMLALGVFAWVCTSVYACHYRRLCPREEVW